ncbi:MAG TPA: 2Fe-2S iron-sulfur cluster-binding protein [Terriglobia bacterium]|nr:2Fe-2S iron-sulfur cluster-binding protein [Terriglobia bacterium]
MVRVRLDGAEYTLAEGESVLAGLLRQGVGLTSSCRAGVCGSCVMRATAGAVPERAQSGLKDSWKARGYFLACVCVPAEDLELTSAGADFRFSGVITSLRMLGADVIQANLATDTPIDFHAGQYITVARPDGLARSYSIASLPGEGGLALHIRKVPNGQMSGWFHSGACEGERVTILGPSGECFYVPGRSAQPLLLAGTGTGLAPLYGIVRDALAQGHTGPIHLFHGALRPEGLYLVDELRRLDREYPQFSYTPAALRSDGNAGVAIGPLDAIIEAHHPDLTGWRGFVCGDPALVQDLKKKLFLAGMASRDIYADAFIPAAR